MGVRSASIRQMQASQIQDGTWVISGKSMEGLKGKKLDTSGQYSRQSVLRVCYGNKLHVLRIYCILSFFFGKWCPETASLTIFSYERR